MSTTPRCLGAIASEVLLIAATLAVIGACGTVIVREEQFENEARSELRHYYDAELAEEWVPIADNLLVDRLPGPERQDTVAVEVEEGKQVGVLGSCDGDCGDLNLAVYDPEWTLWAVDSDTPGEGKYPFAFGQAEASGTYRVVVQMPNCRARPCYYAVWFLQRRDAGGPEARSSSRPMSGSSDQAATEGTDPR